MIKFYIKGQENPLFQKDGNWNYIYDNYCNQLHREDGPAVIMCNLERSDPNDFGAYLYFLNGKLTGEGPYAGFNPKEYLKEFSPSIENLIIMTLSNNDNLREAACEKLKELENETL